MHAAIVTAPNQPFPTIIETPKPDVPSANSHLIQIKVLVAGLHNVVKSRASGKHYSAGELPHHPGVDGVGSTPDGKLVHFHVLGAHGVGSFAEYVNIPKRAVNPLPEGVDPYQVAAYLNPGMSSWMALATRTNDLPKGFTALIMGVTSASGSFAISVCKAFGAGRVIGMGRNVEAMVKLGLKEEDTIVLKDKIEDTDFSALGEVDLILDYIYGPPTEYMFRNLPESKKELQYIFIGGLSGSSTINLPGACLRARKLTMRGCGKGSWSGQELAAELPKLVAHFANVPHYDVRKVPLTQLEEVWNDKGDRVVFTF